MAKKPGDICCRCIPMGTGLIFKGSPASQSNICYIGTYSHNECNRCALKYNHSWPPLGNPAGSSGKDNGDKGKGSAIGNDVGSARADNGGSKGGDGDKGGKTGGGDKGGKADGGGPKGDGPKAPQLH